MIRINKFLAKAGLGSRRSCEILIRDGKVKVNSTVITDLATQIDPSKDVVEYKNKRLHLPKENVYIMLNKPPGYIVTAGDPYERKTVFELLPEFDEHIFAVGRLDKNSEGLLLLTSDGDFAQKITHPSTKLAKTYLVRARGKISFSKIRQLRDGIELDDGKTSPAKVFIKSYNKSQDITKLRMVIYEGRNRQIKRMVQAIGSSVIELKRVQIASIVLGKLPQGHWRFLKDKEIQSILNA